MEGLDHNRHSPTAALAISLLGYLRGRNIDPPPHIPNSSLI